MRNEPVHLGRRCRRHRGGTSPAVAGGTPLGPIGVQLYTVRDEMQKDVAATLARVARIGYKEVEFAGYFNHSPAEIRSMLDANGLTAPSSHIPLQMMQADPAGVAATAKVIGHEYVVVPYLEANMRNDWHGLAKTLNQIGGEMSKQGLKLGYHNHNFEFAPNGSEPLPYQILVDETDPALVKLEMDLYWATMAGQDPLVWFASAPAASSWCTSRTRRVRRTTRWRRSGAARSTGIASSPSAHRPGSATSSSSMTTRRTCRVAHSRRSRRASIT